jgi:hypothetical protein
MAGGVAGAPAAAATAFKEEIFTSSLKLSQYKSGLFMLSLKMCIQQCAYIFTVNYK